MDQGKECPHCGTRVLAFMESADGVACHPCGHGLSDGEWLVLKEAFLADAPQLDDGEDDGFGLGGDWWKG